MPFSSSILIVDDEPCFLRSTASFLRSAGFTEVRESTSASEAVRILSDYAPQVVLVDISMPGMNGRDLLDWVLVFKPECAVIMMTGFGVVAEAVQCLHKGAFDYLTKPLDVNRLIASIRMAQRIGNERRENFRLKKCLLGQGLANPEAFQAILSEDPQMLAAMRYAEVLVRSGKPILLRGEPGTGKAELARAMHNVCHANASFLWVSKASELLEPLPQSGTVFLHEIHTWSILEQNALAKTIAQIDGGDVLWILSAEGVLTESLSNLFVYSEVSIPPLRNRLGDLQLLAMHFISVIANEMGKREPAVHTQFFSILSSYAFPGNVDELVALIRTSLEQHKSGVLSLQVFRDRLGQYVDESDSRPLIQFMDTLPTLDQVQELLIVEALRRAKGNQTIAAQVLGISRRALNNRLCRAETDSAMQMEVES